MSSSDSSATDRPTDVVAPDVVEPRAYTPPDLGSDATPSEPVAKELGQRVQTGFQDLSRLLGAIKETLQGRDGQVQQTLQALPDFLQQVPRIHRAEIECLAQISKQLEHMGSGTRDVVARLDGLPDLLRSLMLGQAEQARFLDGLQANVAEALETQSSALREGLETNRKSAETQLAMIRSMASTQEDIFSTFQNTQNRALNVFHRAQQQTIAQNKDTTKVMNRQIEMLVEKVHAAQGRVFWLSIGFAALAAAGLLAVLFLK
jgi:ABC-type transporter Mla subunit MlaD